MKKFVIILLVSIALFGCQRKSEETKKQFFLPPTTTYNYVEIDSVKLFYREAGDKSNPTIVLLHGYPSSSHSYRNLIPMLATHYHVIAPDNLGSGYSTHLDPGTTTYTFDVLADYTEKLIDTLKIKNYVMYMQDFGAPIGYRMMMKKPSAKFESRHARAVLRHHSRGLPALCAPAARSMRVYGFQSDRSDPNSMLRYGTAYYI